MVVICLLQSLIFFTGLISGGKLQRQRRRHLHRLFPPFVLLVHPLLEAARAARLPVRIQLRGHGVGEHASQDVVLRGHHVLDEKIGSVVDVEVVLKVGHFSYRGKENMWKVLSCFCIRHFNHFKIKMWFVFSYTIYSRLRLVTFHLQNVEFGCNMKQHTSAPVTHGCQQRVCEHLQ